jgi:hypothetical protein
VARHRVVLATLVAVVAADALLRRGARPWEWVVAAGLGAAASGPSRRSWGHAALSEVRYLLRRRVTWVGLERQGDYLRLQARGTRRLWCYDYSHRGRLDLAGRDHALAQRLSNLADSLALGGPGAHLSVHVESREGVPRTTLSVTAPSLPPSEWRPMRTSEAPAGLRQGREPVLERRHYVRTEAGPERTIRIEGFAPGREDAALEALGAAGPGVSLALHAAVLPAQRARHLAARAVHRVGSDASLSRSAGFRWSARREFELDALRHREQSVAAGSALCRWALYIVVRAPTVRALEQRVDAVGAAAGAAGLRLDLGTARQGEWHVFQMPGGPGW